MKIKNPVTQNIIISWKCSVFLVIKWKFEIFDCLLRRPRMTMIKDCWLDSRPEDTQWHPPQGGVSRWSSYVERAGCSQSDVSKLSRGKLTERENVDVHGRAQEIGYKWRVPGVKPLLNQGQHQKHFAGARRAGLLLRGERQRIRAAWCSVWSFHRKWGFGVPCHPLLWVQCFIKSRVNTAIYKVILEPFITALD